MSILVNINLSFNYSRISFWRFGKSKKIVNQSESKISIFPSPHALFIECLISMPSIEFSIDFNDNRNTNMEHCFPVLLSGVCPIPETLNCIKSAGFVKEFLLAFIYEKKTTYSPFRVAYTASTFEEVNEKLLLHNADPLNYCLHDIIK